MEPVPPELLPVASRRSQKQRGGSPLCPAQPYFLALRSLGAKARTEGRQSRFARPLRLITLWPAIRLHPHSPQAWPAQRTLYEFARTFRRKTQNARTRTCATPVPLTWIFDAVYSGSLSRSTLDPPFSICSVTFFLSFVPMELGALLESREQGELEKLRPNVQRPTKRREKKLVGAFSFSETMVNTNM